VRRGLRAAGQRDEQRCRGGHGGRDHQGRPAERAEHQAERAGQLDIAAAERARRKRPDQRMGAAEYQGTQERPAGEPGIERE
jgi:hypothetical protein